MKIKPLLFPMARWFGFFKLTRYLARRYPIILVYHRFGAQNGNPHYTYAGTFESQIRLLKHKFNLLSLRRLHELIEADDPIPVNSVVLTVDDGYEDFFTFALPVLRKYSVPATVFVATDFIGGRAWLWPDQIAYLILQTDLEEVSLELDGGPVRLKLGNRGDKMLAWGKIADYALDLPDAACRDFINELSERLAVKLSMQPSEAYRPMSWRQVQEVYRAGMEIGSHTCTHPRLTRVDDQQLSLELGKSKVDIENHLQDECSAFCYPFGRKVDISNTVKAAVVHAGYRYATIGYFNLNVTGEPYALKRLGAGNDWPDFIKKVYGWEVLQTFISNRPYDR